MSGEHPIDKDALRSEAVYWYLERKSGEMTPEDERNFREWINQSGAHLKAYQNFHRIWQITGFAKNDPVLLRTPYRTDIEDDGIEFADEEIEEEASPEQSDEPEPSQTPEPIRAGARRLRLFAVAASALLTVGVGTSLLTRYLIDEPAHVAVQNFQTKTGQRATVTLSDGTIVTLDSETQMRFMDKSRERDVILFRGRAFFKVAKNAARPFVVNAEGQRVRAIGTAFEVSIDRGQVAVVLAEGKVRVEEARKPALGTDMTPGRQLVINSTNAKKRWVLSNVDVKKETGWTEGRLTFVHDSLTQAVAEVNRYSTRKLTFKDGAIPDKEIVGVFSAGDIEGFIRALEMNGIARRVSTTDDEIILVAGE